MVLLAKKKCDCEASAWRLQRMAYCVLRNAETVRAIKTAISQGDFPHAKQLWMELDDDEQIALWVAPTKGGIFSSDERDILHNWTE